MELDLSRGAFTQCKPRKLELANLDTVQVKRPKPVRSLWGNAKGKFKTRGRYSITSVRGTNWLTEDSCKGTYTQVDRGVVQVLDLITGQMVRVPTGQNYLAKAPVEFPTDPGSAAPTAITAGPDGNMWVSEYDVGYIAKVTPTGGVAPYAVVAANQTDDQAQNGGTEPNGIVAGPDKNLWFTDQNASDVGRMNVRGTAGYFNTSGATLAITVGPDNHIWFLEDDLKIGRISTSGELAEFPAPQLSATDAITAGPDGNVWFTVASDNAVARITPTGAVTEFLIPTPDSNPSGITTGPDGNIWFTEHDVGKIGRIARTGSPISEFTLPAGDASGPLGITTGPGKSLWFTEFDNNRIGIFAASAPTHIREIQAPTSDSEPNGITTDTKNRIWFTEESASQIACIGC